MSAKQSETRPEDDARLCREIHDALLADCELPPVDEIGVEAAEPVLADQSAALPDALRDPGGVFEGGSSGAPVIRRLGMSGDQAAANLARAARDGGAIPPELEQQMARDRLAAEIAMDAIDDGETDR